MEEFIGILLRVNEHITGHNSWVKVFRINPEFRILRLTFHRKSASKCLIKEIIIASLIYFQFIIGIGQLTFKT